MERETDLRVPGPVFAWSHSRSYDSHLLAGESEDPNNPSGMRWHSDVQGIYLTRVTSGDLVLKSDASTVQVFPKGTGDTWTAPGDIHATLEKKPVGDVYDIPETDPDLRDYEGSSSHVYVLEDIDSGRIHIFDDFDNNGRARLYEKRTRELPESQYGVFYQYGAHGVELISTAAPQGWSVDYVYASGRLSEIKVYAGAVMAPASLIMQAEYTYFNGGIHDSDVGTTGDLVQVKVSRRASDGTTWIVRTTQYRYYKNADSNGKAHQLKGVYEADAIERAVAGESLGSADAMLGEADSVVEAYASRKFTYYTSNTGIAVTYSATTPWGSGENLESKYGGSNLSEYNTTALSGMVRTETINAGCASCGGGSGSGITRTYHS